jgi:hypothetical protein
VVWERAAALRIDAAGHWLDATDEALDLLGVPSVDVLRGLPADAFAAEPPDPAERSALADAYDAAFAEGMLIEGPVRRFDGELVRARTAVMPDRDGAFNLLVVPLERGTRDLSSHVLTISEVLQEWRSSERRLVALDPDSAEAQRVRDEIEALRQAHRRLFRRAALADG